MMINTNLSNFVIVEEPHINFMVDIYDFCAHLSFSARQICRKVYLIQFNMGTSKKACKLHSLFINFSISSGGHSTTGYSDVIY